MTDFDTSLGVSPIAEDNDEGGDVEARVHDVVSTHVAALQRIAVARVGPEVADDVVSETFAVAWIQLADGRSIEDVDRPWLVGILLNRCRMHHRAERRWRRRQLRGQAFHDAGADLTGGISAVTARVEAQELGPTLLQAFACLTDSERTALALQVWGELTPTEVAIAMDLTPATVRSHLFRARQRLAIALESRSDESRRPNGDAT